VQGDLTGGPVRLGQVLTNLVGNAVKFTEHGKVSVNVSVKAMTNDRACLQFSIRGTGIGIAPEPAKRRFQKFQQAQTAWGGSALFKLTTPQIFLLPRHMTPFTV
jgi:two-component system, sensor histidine kinase and response regulator